MRQKLWEIFRVQLKVGSIGFGGPLATMALMRREWVERRAWIDDADFLKGLAAVKLLPGPVATLLAVFLGMKQASWLGGIVSALGFILPSFLMILGLAAIESQLSHAWFERPWVALPMKTLQVLVFAVILQAAWKLFHESSRTEHFGQKRLLESWGLAALALVLMIIGTPEIAVLLASAVIGLIWLSVQKYWKAPRLRSDPWTLFLLFFGLGFSVFGTGYALFPVLQSTLVVDKAWLSDELFLRAILYGNLTPGPIVIASTYMGYQMSGFWGAIAATVGIFGAPILLMLLIFRFLNVWFQSFLGQALIFGLLPAVAVSLVVASWTLASTLEWNLGWGLLLGIYLGLIHFQKTAFWKLALISVAVAALGAAL